MVEGTLLQRSGPLKHDLLAYAQARHGRELRRAIDERFGPVIVGDEGEIGNFLDEFVLQHHLPNGRTVLEHFVAAHPELPEAERAMLLGWRDVVEGIFEIRRRDGEALVVVNLVDELTYRVRSNMGPAAFSSALPGSFLIARLVPLGEEWLVSGYVSIVPASERSSVLQSAGIISTRHPELVFRNPKKLEQGWALQREDRQSFIDFFGADVVVIPVSEMRERFEAYHHFRAHEIRDAEGRSVADRARERYGKVPKPNLGLPEDFPPDTIVGVIYDEVDGLNFFPGFDLVDETFVSPQLVADPDHREAVLGYLKSPGISPLPLRRVAERDSGRASQVFKAILEQPDFAWERDGEVLLRRYKPQYFEHQPLPSTIPVEGAVARAQVAGKPSRKGRQSRKRKKSKR